MIDGAYFNIGLDSTLKALDDFTLEGLVHWIGVMLSRVIKTDMGRKEGEPNNRVFSLLLDHRQDSRKGYRTLESRRSVRSSKGH